MLSPVLLTIGNSIDQAFSAFDLMVFRFFGSMQCGFLTYLAKFFTAFGDENFTIPIVVLSVVLCFFKRTRKYGFSILFAVVIGTLITNVIAKPMVLRIRPYNTLQQNAEYWSWYIGAGALSESDYSFPSGHTTSAVEVAMALFYCFRSDKKKIAWLFPCVALCTMGSRVYLMVHYPTDVLGGLIVGVVAGSLGYLLMKQVMKIKVLDKVDAAKLFKKVPGKAGIACIGVAVLGIFLYAFIPSLSEGGDHAVRCAYDKEYKCYNAARVDDEKYPAIDGKEYCKIHWKELSGVKE